MKSKKERLQALIDCLKENKLCISWTCSDCSDMWGVYDDQLVIKCEEEVNRHGRVIGKRIFEVGNNWIDQNTKINNIKE